jgi:RNA polymerase sigma factor (sigma-70 family)
VSIQTGHHPEEKALVEHVLRGDHAAFGQIIKNTEALVAAIVYKMVADTEARKDLAQDIYLKVFHKMASFKFQCKLSTWIAQIAYNTCFSWLEKKKLLLLPAHADGENETQDDWLDNMGHKSTDLFTSTSEALVFKKQTSLLIQQAINQLPPVYRTLVALYHQQDYSYAEIAIVTGLPEGTVKSYLFRARKALQQSLVSLYKNGAL